MINNEKGKNMETFPVLYILMRNDMESMNSGKAMAQASHASNAFMHRALKEGLEDQNSARPYDNLIEKWRNETSQGFGTVLVLAVNHSDMEFTVNAALNYGFMAEVIHDPTYPLRDGDTTHFIPVDTCAYVFADKNDPVTNLIMGNFPLHP